MTSTLAPAASRRPLGPTGLIEATIDVFDRIPYSALALAARIFPAAVFWQSGQTKVSGFGLSDSAVYLFQEEYRLPLVDPTVAAYGAAAAEHLFPVLLVVGLASRFSALALLMMTLVIEIFVYPDAWPTHGVWAACFLLVIARGPGVIALDHLIASRAGRQTSAA
ncbi:DoxX family protein [Hansschlegelia zhihuaiae]|uniref:DoxX family protein n=1 Tax=Hansschlegelia zhihuaiae TaxID=405005 RepID=A0A4Q0M652_9HYPH|nr:DoxX family protein [Hansschlegelia zhihuaiae]RXF68521.1 DoxX family protein [Hansschlegelia zhihuaiae]